VSLQDCGCYDGPYHDDLPGTLVSVRCVKHQKLPPLVNHSLMFRDEKGEAYSVAPRNDQRKVIPVSRHKKE
jgi:hypothetical protein